MNRKIFKEALV